MKEIMFFYFPKKDFPDHPPYPMPTHVGLVRAETDEEASAIIERNRPPDSKIGNSEITGNQRVFFDLRKINEYQTLT